MNTAELCACGHPLHYSDPEKERFVRERISLLGEFITIHVGSTTHYRIPVHYIALHGVTGANLIELARRYGWGVNNANNDDQRGQRGE